MALEKSITLHNYGLELPNSYHKIDSIRIENGHIEFMIKVFASKEARDSGATPLNFVLDNISYTQIQAFTGDDLIAKLYDYVKKANLEYTSGTTDV